jgi:hypothetical protein
MSLHDVARHVLSSLCDERYDGPAVVFSDSPTVERIPRRRHHAREREQHRVSDMAREAAEDLRRGVDAAVVTQIIATAGLTDSVRVVRGFAELLEAVEERFRCGDNVWDDGATAGGVIVLRFWHDRTHRRVSDAYPFSGRS